eukprot:gene4874-5342_t
MTELAKYSNESENMLAPVAVRTTGDFFKLGIKYGTDKISDHAYHRFHPRFIEGFRHLSGYGMLEIGIQEQNSLLMWQDYFEHLFIYGMDIGMELSGPRHLVGKVDQGYLSQVHNFAKRIAHPICFINDDGSHIPEHQLACFNYLFQNVLQPGGVYIIEDIETSYWRRGGLFTYNTSYGYHTPYNMIEVFRGLLDLVNSRFLSKQDRHTTEKALHRVGLDARRLKFIISSITFGQNCIIIIRKTREEEFFNHWKYRFYEFVQN